MINRRVSWLLPVACLWQAGMALAEDLPARLDWAQHLVVATPESGLVERVAVGPGETVRAGQELLRLDSRGLEARLAEAGAGIEEAEARQAEAERERDRTRELYDRTLLAEHELQLAHIALAEARTRLLAVRARQAELRQRLDYRILRAPWDGQVVAVAVQPGQAVLSHEQPMPLLELVRDGQWLARAEVGAERLPGLQPGMALEVRVAGQRYEGKLHALGWQPLAGEGEPRYALDAVFSAPAGQGLRPGMVASIRLP
jgi:membrane fusion protein, multidrug efflux system